MKKQPILLSFLIFLLTACTYDTLQEPVSCNDSGLNITLESTQAAQCGLDDGQINFLVTGTTSGLLLSISPQAGSQSTNSFSGLPAGEYIITAKNNLGCEATLLASVQNETGVQLGDVTSSPAGCGTSNGSITINVSGGTPPYQYQLNGGDFQSSNVFVNLSANRYSVTIKDNNNCRTQATADVTSGVSFSATIGPLISSRCATSGCHNGSVSPDLRTFSGIQSNASRIKSETSSRSMPQGSSLTQTQIDQIACWVDDGALNN